MTNWQISINLSHKFNCVAISVKRLFKIFSAKVLCFSKNICSRTTICFLFYFADRPLGKTRKRTQGFYSKFLIEICLFNKIRLYWTMRGLEVIANMHYSDIFLSSCRDCFSINMSSLMILVATCQGPSYHVRYRRIMSGTCHNMCIWQVILALR